MVVRLSISTEGYCWVRGHFQLLGFFDRHNTIEAEKFSELFEDIFGKSYFFYHLIELLSKFLSKKISNNYR